MQGRFWTISNGLSFARVLLVVPIVLLLLRDEPPYRYAAALLMVVALMTDFLDGLIARRMNQVSDVGKIVDPLADKIGIGAVMAVLAAEGKLPVWFLAAVLARDAGILAGGILVRKYRGILLQSNVSGKWTAGILALFILVTVVAPPEARIVNTLLLAACVVMLTVSFALYSIRFIRVFTERDVK